MVVVPTYNEAHNLPELVRRLFALSLSSLKLLVVDDNSPDGTGNVADKLEQTYPGSVQVLHRTTKLGMGTAYVEGFQFALQQGADVLVQMDADLSHTPEDLPKLVEALSSADVAVGSRYCPGGALDPNWGWQRRLISRLGNLYARWASGVRVRDATGGFKAYRVQVLQKLNLNAIRSRGFAFQIEVAHQCQHRCFRIVEVPILFLDRKKGSSKLSHQIVLEALWRLPLLRWARYT